jgi:hypothetical protein
LGDVVVKRVYRPETCAYLRRYGLCSDGDITKVLSGFDFAEPLYLQPLSIGDLYYQFARTSSFEDPDPRLGSWYCLKGSDMSQLAIHSPNSVRLLGEFEVTENILVLEGIAKDLPFEGQPKRHGVGGTGGGTQFFVPPFLRSGLRNLGLHI